MSLARAWTVRRMRSGERVGSFRRVLSLDADEVYFRAKVFEVVGVFKLLNLVGGEVL